nr:hypothetical protein [Tanacetum cinerariifolium]
RDCNADVPESSGISNPTATSKVLSADQVEHAVSLTVEYEILNVSSHVPTVCLDISLESSSGSRLILKGVFSQKEMDVKSAFLYGTIDEEVYVMQPPRLQDPEFPERVYKALMHDKFQMSAMGELTFFLGLQVLQKKNGIFLSQDKYVGDILKKFGYSDVRYMIGSLMYLTASRPDIMFAVCACARHQVTPKEWHLHTVKRIFRYLKGHPKTGLCDYGGATQDRKSTTRGCQFLGRRLISWQCKKQTIVATSTTKAEYVVAASGCRQVLWIQNQMLDYGILTKRAIRIAQSKALLPDADEPASLSRDDRQGEAFLTVFSLDAGQDREDIAKT